MVREASLTQADMNEVAKCRRDHNRLGFAYQIGFARLFNRFPAQQPLEINDELLSFVAANTAAKASSSGLLQQSGWIVQDRSGSISRLARESRSAKLC